jgi:hypothetical protein
MNIKKRIEQIENNMISKDTVIPPGKETIVFYPGMCTEEEKKSKSQNFLTIFGKSMVKIFRGGI